MSSTTFYGKLRIKASPPPLTKPPVRSILHSGDLNTTGAKCQIWQSEVYFPVYRKEASLWTSSQRDPRFLFPEFSWPFVGVFRAFLQENAKEKQVKRKRRSPYRAIARVIGCGVPQFSDICNGGWGGGVGFWLWFCYMVVRWCAAGSFGCLPASHSSILPLPGA